MDDPDFEGLTALRETKKDFPSIPILLFTERGSEALAVWALRSRVWDYFVTPVAEEELLQRIRSLSTVSKRSSDEISRRLLMPPTPLPSEERLTERSNVKPLQAAVNHIDGHFHEEILQPTLAQACGMSPFQFSRSFKRHYGMTFQKYLTQRRIREAARMLQNLSGTVTEVCFAVGFNDLSHFTRTFRRHLGITPSMYKRALMKSHSTKPESTFEIKQLNPP